jgi:outer membrane protein assembly factor BamA
MQRLLLLSAAVALFPGAPAALSAQDVQPPLIDSIAVQGSARLTASQIVGTSGLVAKQPVNYRDIQRAITALFRTGQFDDVLVEQQPHGGGLLLTIKVKERPLLE